MLAGVDAALDHIRRAAVESGFRPSSGDEERINIDVPFSLRKRRRGVRFTGAASPSPHGAIIAWTADPGPLNHEHLAGIEEKMPEGVMDYQGIEDAALRAGLAIGGRTTLPVPSNLRSGTDWPRAQEIHDSRVTSDVNAA